MQRNGLSRSGFRIVLAQDRSNVFIGQAMKAVAAHAGVVQLLGQCEALGYVRIGAVKRIGKAGDLWQFRYPLKEQMNRRDVVRFVQWRERSHAGDFRGYFSVNSD